MIVRALLVILVAAGSVFAQPRAAQHTAARKSTPPINGFVSGSVFTITASGDLKPARMAKVYLLNYYGAGAQWSSNETQALLKFSYEILNGTGGSDSLRCRKELFGYDGALVDLLKWAQDKPNEIVTGNADEDGHFKISAQPREYILLVRGRAGFNEALWKDAHITVKAGKETTLKLSSPEKACVVME